MQPVIKWTGSKRSQAGQIISLMPKEIDTYYEPFVGGGSVFAKLIEACEEGKIKVNRFVLSDTNKEKVNELVLEQMYYVLNNFDFTTLAGFDMGLNSSVPLSEITSRYISPIVKEELKNSNFLYRGIY